MLGSSEKGMRKAVAKAAGLLWYSRFGVHDISVKTYLRKGKEKLAVSWSYTNDEGKELEGVLLVFSTMDDLEANFDNLATLTSEGVAQITVLLPDGLALSTFNYDAPHF